MSVIVATAYMDEAERFDWLVAMDAGKVDRHRHAGRDPARRRARTTLEEAFIALLPEASARSTRRWSCVRASLSDDAVRRSRPRA